MIVGFDPGTTSALAVLDLKGELLMLVTMGGGVRQAKELIAPFKPVIISSDKRFMVSVQQLATSFGAITFFPKKDLTLKEKAEITKAYKPQNQHEKDALASALYAYRHYRTTIKKVFAKERDIFKLLLDKKLTNLSEIDKTNIKGIKPKRKDLDLTRRVKDLIRKLEIAENIIKAQEKTLNSLKEQTPKTIVKKHIVSKGLREERNARLRIEKDLSEAHSRLSKIEAKLKQLNKITPESTSKEKEDIRGWIYTMIQEYKRRFRK
ncbi:MAG: DUF460 domain-containing protein [Candidatus Altiarchaeota archaeon]|nr:DUF460 domain-containing protein [Candidatus Altiarchaeota archaeon]